jgi:hypothetical protein
VEQVFISWSGEPSRSIARLLSNWLPEIAQHVKPWMSDQHIKGGMRWNAEVAAALDVSRFGIICVTASNQHKPWLMFEAGALAKRLEGESGRVVPLCIDLGPTDVTGPLDAFQGHQLNEEGMRSLVQELMELRENAPDISRVFKRMWPELEAQVNEAKQQSPAPESPERTEREMLKELVERVRRLDQHQSRDVSGTAFVTLGASATDMAKASDAVRWPIRPKSGQSGVDLLRRLLAQSDLDSDLIGRELGVWLKRRPDDPHEGGEESEGVKV